MNASEACEVVIVGGGIAGMAAAVRLKDRDLRVLETDAEVGGRTLSRRWYSHWANFGAQAITTDDKVRMTALAEELGCVLLPSPGHGPAALAARRARLGPPAREEVARIEARLDQEASRPRDPTLPELDDRPFAAFLASFGELHQETLQYFEDWIGGMLFGSALEVSLFGALLIHGDQWASAWSTDDVPRTGRGSLLVQGGTQEVCLRAAAIVGRDRILTNAGVQRIEPTSAGPLRVTYTQADETRHLHARQVIVATPAPVAAALIPSLPREKRAALDTVTYGRLVSTPIFLAPSRSKTPGPTLSYCRPDRCYFRAGAQLPHEGQGGESLCVNAYLYDADAKAIWDDPDHTIITGVLRGFAAAHPALAPRVQQIAVQRFRHGLPRYFPGRMKLLPRLQAPVGAIHFAGDYTQFSNTDGAVRSGEAAALAVRAALDAGGARDAAPFGVRA